MGVMEYDNPPTKHDPERFSRELFFSSYVFHRVAEFQNTKEYTMTRLTKIAVNYVQDWNDILGSPYHYRSFMTLLPHPYGLIATMPRPFDIRIYKLYRIANNRNLWTKRTTVIGRNAVMLSDSSAIGQILLNPSYDFDFDFRFNENQLELASFLSQIYSKLKTKDLNVLGSHRNINKSKDCVEYALRAWETNYQGVYPILQSQKRMNATETKKQLLKMARCCEQIEMKIGYVQRDILTLINNYEVLGDETYSSSLERSLVRTIVNHLREKSTLSKGEESYFDGQRDLNKNFLYPVTESLISCFESTFGKKLDRRSEIVNMREALSGYFEDTKASASKISSAAKFTGFIENIQRIHARAVKLNPASLRKFRTEKYALIDWEIDDGREE
jgi:hypothetical protein